MLKKGDLIMNAISDKYAFGFEVVSDDDLETITGAKGGWDWHCTVGSVGAALAGGLAAGPYGVLAGGATGMATFCK